MQIQITFDDTLDDTLKYLASQNSLTPEVYAGNIVQSFLDGQYRGAIIESINQTPLSDLATAQTAINDAVGAIKGNPII